MQVMQRAWLVSVVALLALASCSPCRDGLTAGCNSFNAISKSASEPCVFDCVCEGPLTNFSRTFQHSLSQCVFARVDGTAGNAAFAWISIDSQFTENISNTLSVSSGPTWVNVSSSPNSQLKFATVFSFPTSENASMSDNLTIFNLPNPRANFTGGVTQCVPYMGGGMYTPDDHEGYTWWQPTDAMAASFLTADLLVRRVTSTGNTPWTVLRANVPAHGSHKFNVGPYECDPLEIAFRTKLNVSGLPNLECPLVSSTQSISNRKPPSDVTVVKVAAWHEDNLYRLSIDWMPSQVSGGCDNITYQLSVVSLNSGQWGVFQDVWLVGTEQQNWVVHGANLLSNLQYAVVISPRTAAGSGPQVHYRFDL